MTKLDSNALYRCVEPLSFVDEEGVPQTISGDTVLLGSDPIVRRFERYFAREGDRSDQQRVRMALIDPAEEAKVRRLRRSGITTLETKAQAKRMVRVDIDGEERVVKKGELIDPSELIVSLIPSAFKTITRKVERN